MLLLPSLRGAIVERVRLMIERSWVRLSLESLSSGCNSNKWLSKVR